MQKLAIDFSNELLLDGVYVQPISTLLWGRESARLRLTVTSLHTKADLLTAADSFEIIGKKIILSN